MTKKDYILLAGAMRRTRPVDQEPRSSVQWQMDLDEIIQTLYEENPRFNRERFIAAVMD